MSDANKVFLEKISKNLEKNGFPLKAVSFPLESLYENAHKCGANLNKILDSLQEHGVAHEKTTEKIIFKQALPNNDDIMSQFEGMDMDDVKRKSEQMMNDMPPEQLEYAKKMFENMDEKQRQELMEKAMKMFGGK